MTDPAPTSLAVIVGNCDDRFHQLLIHEENGDAHESIYQLHRSGIFYSLSSGSRSQDNGNRAFSSL